MHVVAAPGQPATWTELKWRTRSCCNDLPSIRTCDLDDRAVELGLVVDVAQSISFLKKKYLDAIPSADDLDDQEPAAAGPDHAA